jgi:hypothetical protein
MLSCLALGGRGNFTERGLEAEVFPVEHGTTTVRGNSNEGSACRPG